MLTRSDVGTNSPKSIIFRNCMLAKCYFIDTTACLFLSATKSCALFDPTPDWKLLGGAAALTAAGQSY